MDAFERAKTGFDAVVCTAWIERAKCLSDRRFATIDGAQWEDESWDDMSQSMVRVEVNKIAKGLKRIQNHYRSNRITVNFREITNKGYGCADLLDGLFRADIVDSKGNLSFDNAFMEGSSGGVGAVVLCNDYEDEYDPDNEFQRVKFDIITDADQRVFFGPSRMQDKSDAECAWLLIPHDRAEYDKTYPNGASSWDTVPRNQIFEWYQPDIIWVAWYYEVEIVTEKRVKFRNVTTGDMDSYWASDLQDDIRKEMLETGWVEEPEKSRKRRRVAKYVMNGSEILEDRKLIAGDQIPIVPYFGEWAMIENIERIQGHVRRNKDSQRVYNTQVSKMVERSALAPREVPIFTPEQVAGHEQHWADMNLKRHPYAVINPLTDASGQIVATGPIGNIQPPTVPPVEAALLQLAANDIDDMIGGGEAATEVRSNVSADAMDIAATRMDGQYAEYIDNFRIFMQRVGEVYLGIATEIYVEVGREVDVHDADGGQSKEMLFKAAANDLGIVVTHNDLSAARFTVIADVTEATATRRDKTVKGLISIAEMAGQNDPELASVCLSTAVENMDGEGMDGLKKWNHKRLIKLGIAEPTDAEKAEMAKEAQAEQEPSAQEKASMALVAESKSKVALNEANTQLAGAKVQQTMADAELKAVTAKILPIEVGLDHVVKNDDQHTKRMGFMANIQRRLRPNRPS